MTGNTELHGTGRISLSKYLRNIVEKPKNLTWKEHMRLQKPPFLKKKLNWQISAEHYCF